MSKNEFILLFGITRFDILKEEIVNVQDNLLTIIPEQNWLNIISENDRLEIKDCWEIFKNNDTRKFTKLFHLIDEKFVACIIVKDVSVYKVILLSFDTFEDMNNENLFLSHMSHEIRTPLSGIVSCLDIILTTHLDENQKKFLGIAKSSSVELVKIINDIFDYTKLSMGNTEYESKCIDLHSCLDTVINITETQKEEINPTIDFKYSKDADLPRYIYSDSVSLKKIMLNILDNSLKFTKKGEIVFKANPITQNSFETITGQSIKNCSVCDKFCYFCTKNKCCTLDEEYLIGCPYTHVFLKMSIRDTGIGIPENDKPKLFRSISKISNLDKIDSGTGLGLIIAKYLCTLLDGKIWLESSKLHVGSEFCFVIHTSNCEMEETIIEDSNKSLKDKQVLLLVNQLADRILLTKILIEFGLKVQSCLSIDECLLYAENFDYDICILNTKNELNDSIIQSLKTKGKQFPIILIGSETPFNKNLYDAIETEGVNKKKLFATIKKLINNKISSKFDFKLKILVAEDSPVNRKIIIKYLEKLDYRDVDIAENGVEVLEKCKHKHYDIIFMDIKMPIMDGITAVKSLIHQYRERTIKPYYIAITAYAMSGDRSRFIKTGFNDYISKPIDRTELKDSFIRYEKLHPHN